MSATVLCVQEDRSICGLYADALEAEGFETLPAHDGGQALEILRRQSPDFVLLDVYLPRQDGFEILAELRALHAREALPVLMLCEGDVTPELEERARSLGALGLAAAPLQADELVARVSQCLKAGGAVRTGAARVPQQGSLKQLLFPELMHCLHLERFDGVLMLEHGKKKKAIELRDGWPTSVKSNLISECLGHFLVRGGRCTQKQIDESVKRMRTGEGMQGEILVAMDVLEEGAVVDVLRDHALEKLFEVFSWRDGSFELRPGARVQRGSTIALEGHPSDLIVQGVRRQTPLRWIDRYIERHGAGFLVPAEASSPGEPDLMLKPAETKWVQRLDGSLELGSLADAPETIRRLVFALVCVERLSVARVAGDPEEAREAARSMSTPSAAASSENASEEDQRAELARMANAMQEQDHYGVLGVERDAGDAEIRSAYEKLAVRAHPDRFRGSSSSVRQLAAQVHARLTEARDGIGSEEARSQYDNQLSRSDRREADRDAGRRALQAETHFQRGERLLAERDYESALLEFGRAMEHFPSEGEYRAHYGWCLHLCHPDNAAMLGEAVEHCREGLKLAKDREKPYLLLGRLYKAMGKVGAAKKMFTRAVQIKPQCVEAMRELRIMDMRRDKDKGVLKRIFRR